MKILKEKEKGSMISIVVTVTVVISSLPALVQKALLSQTQRKLIESRRNLKSYRLKAPYLFLRRCSRSVRYPPGQLNLEMLLLQNMTTKPKF